MLHVAPITQFRESEDAAIIEGPTIFPVTRVARAHRCVSPPFCAIPVRISWDLQIQAKMGALTGLTPRLERVQDLGDAQKLALLQQGGIEVAEILRLCRLEPGEFEDELKDMR